MHPNPWPKIPVTPENFRRPPREYGILPFWFLNGSLDPDEMRYQLREFHAKGMPGIILHGRYGLEIPYLSEEYLERICLAVEEAERLGLQTWIYDEMNWPSGTADKRVLQARPDLAQRYIECINFTIRGPWFTYLTGADSRYLDFERSTPVAAFAVKLDGQDGHPQIVDLTPNLSFTNVIPWEAPPGNWRLIYIVEKEADYYIDALNPEATAEFLRLGYAPYAQAVGERFSNQMLGFYTDEPAMHYYLSGADNPVLPWTKDMFRRFQGRNGYNLRPHLPDLFFDLGMDSARVRYDFYTTLTEFYSQAYYQQIHAWCQEHGVLFTGHLLYEEWLRKLIRVEGNLFKHYPHMDVTGVDHLYPIVGNQDRPDEHVAMKVGSSAAHQLGSPRLLCESFGGIFMDASMQRMKWIADWEYTLGVNLLNPHGFHYTLEGARKRDWPPSQFYQYPWWRYYGEFSAYISRLSHLLSGGRHVARVAVLWPLNALFGTSTPQGHNPLGDRTEADFNALTDLLLRLHYDFDYIDEDILASARLEGTQLCVGEESYQLVILPPLAFLQLPTLARLEQFLAQGGRALGMVFLPSQAFERQDGCTSLVDIQARVERIFGINPQTSQETYREQLTVALLECDHPGGGRSAFLQSYALARQLPLRLQEEMGTPGQTSNPYVSIETENDSSRYFFSPPGGIRQEITAEVAAERQAVEEAVQHAIVGLIEPDIVISNSSVFYLHRVRDGQDIFFFSNSTFSPQKANVKLPGSWQPDLWDPSGSEILPLASRVVEGYTQFNLDLPPVGSAFVLTKSPSPARVVATNLVLQTLTPESASGYGDTSQGYILVEKDGRTEKLSADGGDLPAPLELDGEWHFSPESTNALVIGSWLARVEEPGTGESDYTRQAGKPEGWLPMVPGTWSYQLPAEPSVSYPIPVWYRINFTAEHLPQKLELIVDGFAGESWQLFVNGEQVISPPRRSALDSQMQSLEITPYAVLGENAIALRLVLTGPTDGLLDPLKILGDFSLKKSGQGYILAATRAGLRSQSWTEQGYPFYSGVGVYQKRFNLPKAYVNQRVFLEASLGDDVLEVLINGQPAEVRLWAPYRLEITSLLREGENELELRVANTLINLLEAVERPSGLIGAPRLVAYHSFEFAF